MIAWGWMYGRPYKTAVKDILEAVEMDEDGHMVLYVVTDDDNNYITEHHGRLTRFYQNARDNELTAAEPVTIHLPNGGKVTRPWVQEARDHQKQFEEGLLFFNPIKGRVL